MIRLASFVVAAGIAAAAGAPVEAASIQPIDCKVDLGVAERTICRSQMLQVLDAQITEVYADLMTSRRVSAAAKERVRVSQYEFLYRRDACGANRECLQEVMSRRLSRIYNYL